MTPTETFIRSVQAVERVSSPEAVNAARAVAEMALMTFAGMKLEEAEDFITRKETK